MFQQTIQTKKAFTLIEIMVSLAIVGILGTIAFISYSSYTTNARDYKRLSDVAYIKTALDSYQKQNGGVFYIPESVTGTGVVYSGSLANPSAYQMDMNSKIAGVIGISNVPVDPMNQGFYVYSVDAPKLRYQIATTFENSDTKTAYNFGVQTTYAASTDCSAENKKIAYVEGNFIPKNVTELPSLVYAFDHKTSNLDISVGSNKKKAVLNKQNINLAYDTTGKAFTCSNPSVDVLSVETAVNTAPLTNRSSCTIDGTTVEDGGNKVTPLNGTTLGSQIGWKYQTCNNGSILPTSSTHYYTCKNIGEGADFDNVCTWTACKNGYSVKTDGTAGCVFEGSNVALAYPNQGAFGLPKDGSLSWYATQGGNNNYTVYISSDSALEGTPTSVGSNLKYTYSGLTPGTTYYWKVKTTSAVNATKTLVSETRSFTVASPTVASSGGTGSGTTIIYMNGSGSTNTIWSDPCPEGTVCRTDDVFISYVGGNGVNYAKWDFGESRRTQDVLFGDTGTSVYKIENKSDGLVKFKIKAADVSTGSTSTGWIALTKTTSFDTSQALDLGSDGVKNFYMDLGSDCVDNGTTEYSIKAKTTCIVKLYFQSDVSIAGKLNYSPNSFNMVKWYIENTDKLNGGWDQNATWTNGQGDKNTTYTSALSPITMTAKSLDFQTDLRISYDTSTSTGAGFVSSGVYSFGNSTRLGDSFAGIENNLRFKIENKSAASAYFKIKTADASKNSTNPTTLVYSTENTDMSGSTVTNIGGDSRIDKNFYFAKSTDCVIDAKGYRVYPGKICLITFNGRSDDQLSVNNNYSSSNEAFAKFIVENTEASQSAWKNPNNMNDEFTSSAKPVELKIKGLESYQLDLLVSYQSSSGAGGGKHDFGTSAKDGANFHGVDTKLVYTIANRKNGAAYFKLKLADSFSGTIVGTGSQTWKDLRYITNLTSYTDPLALDIGGEKILGSERWASNLYWEKSNECIPDATYGYKIVGNSTCTITFHGRSDPSLAGATTSSVEIAKFLIENTYPTYSPWLNAGLNSEYTTAANPVAIKMKSSGYTLPNIEFTHVATLKQSGETANDGGAGDFGTSTRNEPSPTILPSDKAYWRGLVYKVKNTGNIETYFKVQLGGGTSSRLNKAMATINPKNANPTNDMSTSETVFADSATAINIGSDTRNNFFWNNGDSNLANQCPTNARGFKLEGGQECNVTLYYRGDISVPGKSSTIMQLNFDPTQRVASNDAWQTPIYPFTGKTLGYAFNVTGNAQSEVFGWISLDLVVTGTLVEGYGTSEAAGFICFDQSCGSSVSRDAVSGQLSGHALGETFGWIDMSGVKFNQNGTTSGYAPSESLGWIGF